MSNEIQAQNRLVMKRWFAEVWNAKNDSTIDELFAADGICHGLTQDGEPLVGPAAFRKFYGPFCSAFPDVKATVDGIVAEEDQVVVRLTGTGTHTGDGFGIPPTGRKVRFSAIVWARLRDGKIVEGWNELDAVGLMSQLNHPPTIAIAVKAKNASLE